LNLSVTQIIWVIMMQAKPHVFWFFAKAEGGDSMRSKCNFL
jgi:hypothetical protein